MSERPKCKEKHYIVQINSIFNFFHLLRKHFHFLEITFNNGRFGKRLGKKRFRKKKFFLWKQISRKRLPFELASHKISIKVICNECKSQSKLPLGFRGNSRSILMQRIFSNARQCRFDITVSRRTIPQNTYGRRFLQQYLLNIFFSSDSNPEEVLRLFSFADDL